MVLNKKDYLNLKKKLSFRRNVFVSLTVILIDLVLFYFCILGLLHESWVWYILASLVISVIFFHHFSILHDCGHGSCSSSRTVNSMIGHYASLFCFLPYYPWKYIHQKHHEWSGNLEKDPVLKNMKKWRDQAGAPWLVRFAWRSWVPLAGLFQHVVFWTYPVVMLKQGQLKGKAFWLSLGSIIWIGGIYLSLFLFMSEIFNLKSFGLVFFFYLMLVECVNLPHHTGMPTYDEKIPFREQSKVTRSCYFPFLISELLWLNFNFHIEHHLFPTLPWYRLRKVRIYLMSALLDSYHEEKGISWNLRNRKRDFNHLIKKKI